MYLNMAGRLGHVVFCMLRLDAVCLRWLWNEWSVKGFVLELGMDGVW